MKRKNYSFALIKKTVMDAEIESKTGEEKERERQVRSEDKCLVPKAVPMHLCVCVCVCVSISPLSQLNNDK